jgi:hypothetical protein
VFSGHPRLLYRSERGQDIVKVTVSPAKREITPSRSLDHGSQAGPGLGRKGLMAAARLGEGEVIPTRERLEEEAWGGTF